MAATRWPRRRRPRHDLLRATWLFGECSSRELDLVAGLTSPVHLPSGRELLREGQPVAQLVVVVDGRVDLLVGGRTVGPLPGHGCLGAVPLVDHGPSPVTAVSASRLLVLVLSETEVRRLLDSAMPSVVHRLLQVLAADGRSAAATSWLRSLAPLPSPFPGPAPRRHEVATPVVARTAGGAGLALGR